MTVDVMKGVVMLKNHAEFLRRFVLAQRRVARARRAELQAELEADEEQLRVSDRRRLPGQRRALERRAALWSAPPRRHLAA
eukprot:1278876-Pyramimonas_sp.AAC.1